MCSPTDIPHPVSRRGRRRSAPFPSARSVATGLAVLAASLAPAAAARASGTVSVSIQGAGTVTGTQPSGGQINCRRSPLDLLTGPCSALLADSMLLRASPANGYALVGWSGACSGTATTCLVTGGSVGVRFVRCPLRLSPLGPGRSALRPRC
jgi:hypothetical protein